MADIDHTRNLRVVTEMTSLEDRVQEILLQVHKALMEKGYNPHEQLVGYLLSGDPAYITNHENARGLIQQVGRDELLEALVRHFVQRMEA